jgi:5-methylthioadenosine/S-adenosylhomocysteine deaminase
MMRRVAKVIAADLIWMDGAFRDGLALVIEDGVIQSIGPRDASSADPEEWRGCALVPGAVNAHGHAFQNLLKGFADDRPFDEWRDEILYPFSERLDGEAIYTGALFAFAEALAAGTTTIVDFFYLHDHGNDNAEQVIRAAKDIGIRLVLARALYDPGAPTRAPGRYREDVKDSVDRLRSLARRHRTDPLVSIQPAPHSLHAASPATIRAALEAAHDLGVPCHLHLAEASYEVAQVKERFGETPVRLLAREGLLDPSLLTVHSVWVDDEELDLLAAADVGVVHCPGANAFLGDGIARLPEMLSRGIRVALGPDGGCANNRQSVFDEMRQASLMAKARTLDGGIIGAPQVFELGTRAGSDLLGLNVGVFEPGRRADLVALDLNDLSLFPSSQLERHVVNSMQATAISKVMVEGEVVFQGGEPTRVPSREIRERVSNVTEGWKRP